MKILRNRLSSLLWTLQIILILSSTFSYAQVHSVWEDVPNKVRERKAFKRFEWFYRQRALPYDTIPEGAIESARQIEIEKEKITLPKILSNNVSWNPIGPTGVVSTWPSQWGVVSGRVRAIAVHPTDPNTIYIGPAAGGIWKTTDGGTTWQDIGVNLASLTFGSIAIDPTNPNIVYAGAGEAMRYFNHVIYDGKGLYKSTDAGASWIQITNGFGSRTHFGAVKVSPTNPTTIYAALASGYWHWSTPGNEGLWRSSNAGLSWTRTLNADDGFDVLPHPTIANRVYGATGGGTSLAGFYISTNDGVSWIKSSSGLPSSNLIDRIQIGLSPSVPSTIYALIFHGGGFMTLYKSTDDGASWGAVSSTYSSTQGWYDLVLGVNPANANEVYIGDAELRRSTDGGVNFTYVGGGYWNQSMHVDFHYMVFAPSNPAIRFVGCDGGIYRSTNSGSNWTNINNLPTLQYYRISSHPTNQNIMLGGAQDNGLYQTTNGGSGNWALVSTGDGMESFFDHTNPNIVYASTQNGGLVKSTSGGVYGSFNSIKPSAGTQPWAWTSPFFIHPTNHLTIYTATNRPWMSTDGGNSWTALTGGTVTSVPINTMAQSPVNPNNMILAGSEYSDNPSVHVSTNGGTAWTNITYNIGGAARYISRVVFHPTQASTVFVVRSGFSTGNKIYRSTNLGTAWTNITGDLPDVPHNDLFIDPEIPTEMYTANDLGVYRTTNDGVTWIRQGNNFPYVPTQDFDYFKSGGVRLLRAGTHGRSAYQAALFVGLTISSFSPTYGDVGSTITISGSGFDPIPINNIVYFGGAKATVTAASATTLSVNVPVGSSYAPISVTTGNQTVYSTGFFNVTFATGSGIIDTASFDVKTDFSTQNNPWGVAIADVDVDGKLDVGVANSGSGSISILRNTSTSGSISFATKVNYSLDDSSPRNLAFGDLDGDGKQDVAGIRQSNNSIGVFRNTSTVSSVSLASRQDFGVSTNPFDLVIGDIDGDKKPDIAVANGMNMTVLRNTSTVGNISFASNVDFVAGNGQRSIAIGDIDIDGKPDIATVSVDNNKLYIFRNTSTSGSITFATPIQFSTGNSVYEVSIGFIDNDFKPDISVVNFLDNTVSVFRNTSTEGNISFDARLNFTIGNGGSCVATENINGDNKPDIIISNYSDHTLSVLRNTSSSISFAGKVDFNTGASPYGCSSADIDGNGAPELISANQSANTISILRNRLADTFNITTSVVGEGSILPSGSVVVLHGSNPTFTITPDFGYHVDSVIVDGFRVDSTTSYTFYNITYGSYTITAYFSINHYIINAIAVGNGTILPSGSIDVIHGTNKSFSMTPNLYHHIDSVIVDGSNVGAAANYNFDNIISGHTITAYFSIDKYAIGATASGDGSIIPSGTIIVPHGSDQVFTMIPQYYTYIDDLIVDDESVDSTYSYTFNNVTQNHTIHAKFEIKPDYLVKYRSFKQESLALDRDHKGKINKYVPRTPNKVEFIIGIKNDSANITDLHIEFSSAIDTHYSLDVTPSATVKTMDPKLKKWDIIFSSPINANDSVQIHGFAWNKKEQKISKYLWTRLNGVIGVSKKDAAIANQPRLPMPNRVNALYETFLYNGYGVSGLVVGKNRKSPIDSSKYYGWLQTMKYKDILKTLVKSNTLLMHVNQARGFNVFSSNSKPITKQQKSLPPDKFNNQLLAALVALKVNITASAMGINPYGFGELIYSDGTSNPLNGLMLKEIAAYGDSVMMGSYDNLLEAKIFAPSSVFENLDLTVDKINSAFECLPDTAYFADSLIFNGCKELVDVTYLRANPDAIPMMIVPMEDLKPQIPEVFTLFNNYPNPFNPTTNISFELGTMSIVTLKIFNLLGQEVGVVLSNEEMDEGEYEFEYDASKLSSGVYFYRIVAEGIDDDGNITGQTFVNTRKMLLLK